VTDGPIDFLLGVYSLWKRIPQMYVDQSAPVLVLHRYIGFGSVPQIAANITMVTY
jgi:hypothetical protein